MRRRVLTSDFDLGLSEPLNQKLFDIIRWEWQHREDASLVETAGRLSVATGIFNEFCRTYVCAVFEIGMLSQRITRHDIPVCDLSIRRQVALIANRAFAAASEDFESSDLSIIERFEQELYDLYSQAADREGAVSASSTGTLQLDSEEDPDSSMEKASNAGLRATDVARLLLAGRLIYLCEDKTGAGLRLVGKLVSLGDLKEVAINSLGRQSSNVFRQMFSSDSTQAGTESGRNDEMSGVASKSNRPMPKFSPTCIYVDDQRPLSISALRQRIRYQRRRYDFPLYVVLNPSHISRYETEDEIDQATIHSKNLSDLKRLVGEIDAAIMFIETSVSVALPIVGDSVDAVVQLVAGQQLSEASVATEIRIFSRA